jgi:hypothetical protein
LAAVAAGVVAAVVAVVNLLVRAVSGAVSVAVCFLVGSRDILPNCSGRLVSRPTPRTEIVGGRPTGPLRDNGYLLLWV